MQVWQIAAGERGRYYDDLFLDHDLMFMGDDYDSGDFNHGIEDYRAALNAYGFGSLNRFCNEAQAGDVVLLRKGQLVTAIGAIAKPGYAYNDGFSDVYGWKLPHTRRVRWQRHLDGKLRTIQKSTPLFDTITQMATFTRVKSRRQLKHILPLAEKFREQPLKRLPNITPALSLELVGQKLFEKGLPNDAVDKVVSAITRQRRLAQWYDDQSDSNRPTEHEVVAHMVLPLLLALGWSEQLLAIEWKHIDLAGFYATPTDTRRCVLVCEAKRRGRGMQGSELAQAQRYISEYQLKNCRRILLTEGLHFYLYERRRTGWSERPTGYVNLGVIRECNAAPYGTDAIATIMALTPTNIMRRKRK